MICDILLLSDTGIVVGCRVGYAKKQLWVANNFCIKTKTITWQGNNHLLTLTQKPENSYVAHSPPY